MLSIINYVDFHFCYYETRVSTGIVIYVTDLDRMANTQRLNYHCSCFFRPLKSAVVLKVEYISHIIYQDRNSLYRDTEDIKGIYSSFIGIALIRLDENLKKGQYSTRLKAEALQIE